MYKEVFNFLWIKKNDCYLTMNLHLKNSGNENLFLSKEILTRKTDFIFDVEC